MSISRRTLAAAAALTMAALVTPQVLAQQPDVLDPVARLTGEWVGTSEGAPGQAAAQRHIVRDIAGRFLRVEARSVYPRQAKNPRGEIHTSLGIWSFDKKRKLLVLRHFDSLGFASTYVQDAGASSADKLVLVAEHLENVPDGWSARYTYTFVAADEFHELFELDAGGKGLQPYVSGRYLRVPPSTR